MDTGLDHEVGAPEVFNRPGTVRARKFLAENSAAGLFWVMGCARSWVRFFLAALARFTSCRRFGCGGDRLRAVVECLAALPPHPSYDPYSFAS